MKHSLRQCGNCLHTFRHLLPFIIFLVFTTNSARAQYGEIGAYIGTSTYVGDLSEQEFNGNFQAMLGILGRYNFTPNLSVKASLTKGTIASDDADSKFEEIRMRNLNFRSDIIELSVTGEWNLIPFAIREEKTASPYLFLGLGGYYFNPQAQWKGEWHNLHDLHTERQDYSRLQLAVPFGLGFKFNMSYKVNFGLEFGVRKTFTDYLDDVSTNYPDILEMQQENTLAAILSYRTPEYTGMFTENPVGQARGDAQNNDWYFFIGGTITVNLTDKYGLDYAEKYEPFKEHLKKEPKEKKDTVKKRHKKKKYQKRKKRKKKKQLKPAVKRRSN
ncbi:MAG: DUF6089 family protein [Saprospiraceae bacterium]|jgi:hypothetical protein|nr:DUF6089 family protein [Saprospiraceae bacterium]